MVAGEGFGKSTNSVSGVSVMPLSKRAQGQSCQAVAEAKLGDKAVLPGNGFAEPGGVGWLGPLRCYGRGRPVFVSASPAALSGPEPGHGTCTPGSDGEANPIITNPYHAVHRGTS